jgi:uncharacterized protein
MAPWREFKKINNLETYLRRGPRAVLLFSGGLDSSLLLAVAARALRSGLTALTFTGPHIAPGELAAAWSLARRLRVKHLIREIDPLTVPEFQQNTRQRCYGCKKAIIQAAWEMAAAQGADVLWDGTNVDDLADFRPGLKAARELGVQSPLLETGWDKAAIRGASRQLGLPWEKPPQSCLATRFPYDTLLTWESLARVGQAEAWLRRRGFSRVRLRVRGDRVCLELPQEEWANFLNPQVRRPFGARLARQGWQRVDLDVVG